MTIELGGFSDASPAVFFVSPVRQGSLRGLGEEILWLHCVSASALRRILEVNRYVFAHIL